MAAWDGWTKIAALLVTAGATLSPPITFVKSGIGNSMPASRMIRFWYRGEDDVPIAAGDALAKGQALLQLEIGVYLALGGANVVAQGEIESDIEAAGAAIYSGLWGDPYLGTPGSGASALGLRVEPASGTVLNIDGATVRYLGIPVVYGLAGRYASR